MRSNPDAEPPQRVFDPERLIRTTNKLKRFIPYPLDRTSSFLSNGVTSIDDISKHESQNFALVFSKTKFESSLSEAVFDPSPFDFSHTSWLLETLTFTEKSSHTSSTQPYQPLPQHPSSSLSNLKVVFSSTSSYTVNTSLLNPVIVTLYFRTGPVFLTPCLPVTPPHFPKYFADLYLIIRKVSSLCFSLKVLKIGFFLTVAPC